MKKKSVYLRPETNVVKVQMESVMQEHSWNPAGGEGPDLSIEIGKTPEDGGEDAYAKGFGFSDGVGIWED